MPNSKITKTAVDGLAAGGKRYTAWDSDLNGFGVRVAPSGRKTCIVQYRIGGRHAKSQMVKLGVHGSITPDQARRLGSRTPCWEDKRPNVRTSSRFRAGRPDRRT